MIELEDSSAHTKVPSPVASIPLKSLQKEKYFGEKIGLYFAWLGLYTSFLIPSSVIGVVVFLYGCATIEEDIPSKEMCDHQNAFTMCPLCDKSCDYWNLSSACGTARASHLFDNPATVFFSIFMALWATMFLENWKRLQMRLGYFWDLTGIEEEEEHSRPEYETKVREKLLKESGKSEVQKLDGNSPEDDEVRDCAQSSFWSLLMPVVVTFGDLSAGTLAVKRGDCGQDGVGA
ncbi:hypothetical protein U0070_017751 [Myodes glareolus]|uniref:Anoctamin n=1 Tax=Myodes glareolus TaxID=447135 RepID=A0AAW0HTY2_MYOGA